MALYIGIFDARKAIRHVPVEIDLAAIANSVSGLSETLGDSKEMIYHNESHHALVIVNTAKATKILSKHILNTLNPVNISMNGCIQHLKANYCCKNGTTHQFIKGNACFGITEKRLGKSFCINLWRGKGKSMPNHRGQPGNA